jgi:hypothetical protein
MGKDSRLRNNANDRKVASFEVIPTSPAFTSLASIEPMRDYRSCRVGQSGGGEPPPLSSQL